MKVIFKQANRSDLAEIVALLNDDHLGQTRESQSTDISEAYFKAFELIDADPNALLVVGYDNTQVIALAQLNFIQYLTYQGGVRAQIEGVRVHRDYRGKGIGHQLFEYLIQLAKDHECHVVQLTSDKERLDALKFYEALGFKASHEGFKLHL